MARRVVVVLLAPVGWAPPGIDPDRWRAALAEDMVDLIAAVNEAEPAIAVTAADRALAEAVLWPGMPVIEVAEPSVNAVLDQLSGYDQAAVIAPDAPDLPGLILGKLLRPLTTRPVAVAPAGAGRPGLLGVATRLPVPDWLPPLDLETTEPTAVRAEAPSPADVVVTPSWRRLRSPADLAGLDPAVEGWEATRALLTAPGDRA